MSLMNELKSEGSRHGKHWEGEPSKTLKFYKLIRGFGRAHSVRNVFGDGEKGNERNAGI